MKLTSYLNIHGLTRAEFAARAGINRSTMVRLLDYGSAPRAATIRRIGRATHGQVTVTDLMTEAGEARARRALGNGHDDPT